MSENKESFEQIVSIFRELGTDKPELLERLRGLYAGRVHFQDPIQSVNGVDEFMALNRRLLARSRVLRFEVRSHTFEGDEGFLTWRMYLTPRLGPSLDVDGVSHLQLRDGLVHEHRDYWDFFELFASAIPGGRAALRLLLRPLA